MSWYPKRDSTELIVVEDQLSAIRASRYLNSAALLGVNFNMTKLHEIRDAGFRTVYLCLDKDALANAIKHTIRNRDLIKLIPICPPKDLKDLKEWKLRNILVNWEIIDEPQ